MTRRTAGITLLTISLLAAAGCDLQSTSAPPNRPLTYSGCLASAVAGGSTLSLSDIRELCSEAAGVIDASYEYKDTGIVPANEFTVCYDAEKKALVALGAERATRLAKLSCKYPDAK